MEEQPPVWSIAANISNKQSRTDDRGGPPGWGLGKVLINPHHKNISCYETFI